MPVIFAPSARLDLRAITIFILQDNPIRAGSFVNELIARCEKIALAPKSYALREEISPGLRMAMHGSYLIFFREGDDDIRIERVLHGARNYSGLF